MEGSISSIKGLLKSGTFGSKLIDVLEATDYEGLNVYTGSSKRINELNFYESIEGMRPFIDWFSDSITEDNCLTKDELQIYKKLKNANNLVPDLELDCQINRFYSENSLELAIYDYGPTLELAKKELESLESLDNFLTKREKHEERKKTVSNFDVDAIIKSELENLDKLNESMNEALENYAQAWEDLRKRFPIKNEKRDFCSINRLKKEIDKNLSFHLKNDFKEVKPTEGKITVTAEEYWIVFNKLSDLREEVINVAAKTEGLSVFKRKLKKLKSELNASFSYSSLDDIRSLIHEENINIKLQNSLCVPLKEEVNCITSLKLYDRKKTSIFLTDRLDRLTKIEHILRQQKLYFDALFFIHKRDKIIKDYQLEKLNEILKFIQQAFSKFQERMDNMTNFVPKRETFCDSYYKAMMNLLDINSIDLKSLDDGIAALDDNINRMKHLIDSEFSSLELAVINRLRSIKERNKVLIAGPTREIFDQDFKRFLDTIESASRKIRRLENRISHISRDLDEFKINESLRKDCLWRKCLNDSEGFFRSISYMEASWSKLRKENEDMIGKNFGN